MFGIGKLIDAVTDPLMGYISDITRSRFGRRRIYFLAAIGPIWVSFFLLWLPFGQAPLLLRFIYYTVCYILFSLVYTLVMVPYSALNAEISRAESNRIRLAGSRMVFTQLVTLLAILIPNWLIDLLDIQGYYTMGLVFATLFALPWVFVFLGTWELPYKQPVGGPGFATYFARFTAILRNRTARSHMLMHAASYAAIDILMVLAVFFFTHYLGAPQQIYHLALAVMIITMCMMLPVYYALSRIVSVRLLYAVAMTWWAVGLVGGYYAMQPEHHWSSYLAITAFLGVGTAGGMLMPWTIFPMVTDVGEYFSGENRAGMYAGMLTLTRKLVQGAIVMPLVGISLHSIGYMPQVFPQAQATAIGLQRIFFLAPIGCILIGLLAVLRLPLTSRRAEVLSRTLHARRSGADETATPAADIVLLQKLR